MKIKIISDMHGMFPDVGEGDMLLICGDNCPLKDHSFWYQKQWIFGSFIPWLKDVKFKHKIFIHGNHDLIGEDPGFIKDLDLYLDPNNQLCNIKDIYCLQNRMIEIEGLKIYGTADQPIFCDWAFNKDEDYLVKTYSNIPDDVDILLTHCPPLGIRDTIRKKTPHLGSGKLKSRVNQLKNLKVHGFGHIHGGYGVLKNGKCFYVNGSVCNENYDPINKPIEIVLN